MPYFEEGRILIIEIFCYIVVSVSVELGASGFRLE
jgi:hypothetical protein